MKEKSPDHKAPERWPISKRTMGPIHTAIAKEPVRVLIDGPDTAAVEVQPCVVAERLAEALKVADGWLQHGPGATTHEHASDVVRAALASYEKGNPDA